MNQRYSSSSSYKKDWITRRRRDVSARKRHSRQTDGDGGEGEEDAADDEETVDAEILNEPVNEFIRAYMRAVSKYWPMYYAHRKNMEIQHVYQSVLTRTTIATNMNRTTLTSAGVPFKEFVVTCRYLFGILAFSTR